jgi:hypothetical protein
MLPRTMTAGRQQRKARLVLGVLFGLVACCDIGGLPARAANDPIMINPDTGLAISGFDSVAYFNDHKPVFGRPDLELRVGGVVRRFRDADDRAAVQESIRRASAAMIRWRSRAAYRCGATRCFGWLQGSGFISSAAARATFLTDPGRKRAYGPRSRAPLRPEFLHLAACQFSIEAALIGSPQAMKAGMRKFLSACPKVRLPPSGVVTMPPAAATKAWPAATSHSQVVASRG